MSRGNENSQELGRKLSDTASCACGDRSNLGMKHRKTGPCYSKLRKWTVTSTCWPELKIETLAISQGQAKAYVYRQAREAGYTIPFTNVRAARFK
jgi:hypothetical protein